MRSAELVTENFVWHAISDGLLGRSQKPSQTGFVNICCPMCTSRGESQDRKHRCGIKRDGSDIGISCFNCQFSTRFTLGKSLSNNMKDFLRALGTPDKEVRLIAHWAEKVRRQLATRHPSDVAEIVTPEFPKASLPDKARSLETWADAGCDDPDFIAVCEYLISRGDVAVNATTYYWTPETRNDLNRRLIIPCYQDRRLVGWTARAVTKALKERYHKDLPSNYLFNTQFLSGPRKFVFVVEGTFDALVIDGVSPLGAALNERQIAWITQSGKQPIVVPQRDRAGTRLVDVALKQKWAVSILDYGAHKWWDDDLKDVADAVCRYGKLYVIQSILASMEIDPGTIQVRAKYLWY